MRNELKSLRRQVRLLLGLWVATVVVVGCVAAKPAKDNASNVTTMDFLVCRGISVVDEAGKPRIVLSPEQPKESWWPTQIAILDANGKDCAVLQSNLGDEGQLSLHTRDKSLLPIYLTCRNHPQLGTDMSKRIRGR